LPPEASWKHVHSVELRVVVAEVLAIATDT
jgi:hypothetical protein